MEVFETHIDHFFDKIWFGLASVFQSADDFKAAFLGALIKSSTTGNWLIILFLFFNLIQWAPSHTAG